MESSIVAVILTICLVMVFLFFYSDQPVPDIVVTTPLVVDYEPVEEINLDVSFRGCDVKWLLDGMDDFKSLTDSELGNVISWDKLSFFINDVNDFIYWGERLLPERFKITESTK